MTNFDEIKQRTGETAEYIAAKSIEIARTAAEKTRLVARISKLNADVITEKEALRRAYIDLGKKYYKYFRENPNELLKDNCREIASSIAVITQCRAEIDECKQSLKGVKCEDCVSALDINGEKSDPCCTEKAPDEDTECTGKSE